MVCSIFIILDILYEVNTKDETEHELRIFQSNIAFESRRYKPERKSLCTENWCIEAYINLLEAPILLDGILLK